MKTKILFAGIFVILFVGVVGSITSTSAVHNEEFSENGCDTPDNTLTVKIKEYEFTINGFVNPDLVIPKGSCLKIVSTNDGTIDHDFTFVGTLSNGTEAEIWHMDTPVGETIEHQWQIPDEELADQEYFCEVEGHIDLGMHGKVTVGGAFTVIDTSGDDDGFLPGFGFPVAIIGFLALVAIPFIRRR